LVEDREIEAIEGAQAIDVGLARARRDHHGDGIAGDDAQEDENDDGDPEEGWGDEEKPA
jgi:hypothetical protein